MRHLISGSSLFAICTADFDTGSWLCMALVKSFCFMHLSVFSPGGGAEGGGGGGGGGGRGGMRRTLDKQIIPTLGYLMEYFDIETEN